ncbi:hypothetical protein [Emergencia timonensis]|uniref:hypothetical protein n=1 Tax=Emergencia timonensis TaxID=1776384 RepID=UPI0039943565
MKEHILLEKAFRYTEPTHIEPPAGYEYQPQRGYWANINTGEALMMGDDPRPMQTKKCDRETGEDQKGE